MRKRQIIQKITETGVVAVLRSDSGEKVLKSAEAIVAGGIKAIEVTMTVPGAAGLISRLVEKFEGKDVIVGAGTVLDAETARICVLAGAQFIVTPSVNKDAAKVCNRYGIPIFPGIMTVKEAVEALETGAEILKVFPASVLGMSVIKALQGPLPQAEFMPTGGVSVKNAGEWIRAGAAAIGTGGELTKGADSGDYGLVRQTAEAFIQAVEKARNNI